MSKTYLTDLIEKVSADDLPTNEFTIEDTDPMVLLGKLNEIIANLTAIRDTIDASDTKALEALNNSIKALETANKAITGTIQAIETANTAIETANTSIETANSAKTESSKAITDSSNALSKAETADTNANKAITDSSNALSKAETADTNANKAITDSSNALIKAEDAYIKAEGAESYAINADANASSAIDIANEALSKVVAGLGTIIKDYNGNSLKEANFRGTDTINVDMKENDPNTFEFRLDSTIVTELTTATNNINSILGELTTIKNNISTNTNNINDIWKIIYPIGSYLYNDNANFNPNTSFGGTWELVKGRFLYGADNNHILGSEGGEETHLLTIEEMPSHTHTQQAHNHLQNEHTHPQNAHGHDVLSTDKGNGYAWGLGRPKSAGLSGVMESNANTRYTNDANKRRVIYETIAVNNPVTATNKPVTAINNNSGGGKEHNNMPPYKAVNIWYRKA